MNIIIPLGGKGERFKHEYNKPKPFIPILEKRMLEYVLDSMNCQSDDIVFILYADDQFSNELESICLKYKQRIECIHIGEQTRGSAETILRGLPEIRMRSHSSKCVSMDCDAFYGVDVLEICRQSSDNAIFYKHDTNSKPVYSYIRLEKTERKNKVLEIVEKVKISDNANTGIYYFTDIDTLEKHIQKVIVDDIRFKGEYYTSCVIHSMLKDGIEFVGVELDHSHIFNLGTPQQVNEYIERTLLFLFDLDGTLVLTDDIYYKVWTKILEEYNIELTKDIFEELIQGNADSVVVSKLIPEVETHIISKKKDQLFKNYLHEVRLVDGAIDFINTIKERGHKIGMVTNCNREIAEVITQHYHLQMDTIVIGSECTLPKPHVYPYSIALEYFKVKPQNTIIFEDSCTGLVSAKGIHPLILVGLETSLSKNKLKECGADETIQHYKNRNASYYEIIVNLRKSVKHEKIELSEGVLSGGYISNAIEFEATQENGIFHHYVLKMESDPKVNILSEMTDKLKLYQTEYNFYENISKNTSVVDIPKYIGLYYDSEDKPKGIIMENLYEKGYIPDLKLDSYLELTKNIIERLSYMHGLNWNQCSRLKIESNNSRNWTPFIKEKWPLFKAKWSRELPKEYIEKGESITNQFEEIESHMCERKNLTLCHGDVKSGNIFYYIKRNCIEFKFIDWQYVHEGKGVEDIVFFLIESFSISTMKKNKKMFTNFYYDCLQKYINPEIYSYEEYLKDFEISSYYFPFFVAMWFGTLDESKLSDVEFPRRFIHRLFSFYSE